MFTPSFEVERSVTNQQKGNQALLKSSARLMTLTRASHSASSDAAVRANERSRPVSAAAYCQLPARKLAGLHDLNCSALGPNRDHSKQAVCITVRARCKEELVVCAVRIPGGVLAKLQCPNIVDLDNLAICVAKWAEKLTRLRIERVDATSGNVVANENRITHRAEIRWSQGDAPGRMERAVDSEVLHQITFRIKNVHEATLRFVQSRERHPNVAIYGLNSVRGKTFRDIRVVKGLHQMKCAIEHVNSAVRATIGGIQESACLVGRDSQARVGRTRARSICRESGMTEARRTANRGIPTADRTV